jgi:hypothetical protein
MALVSPVKGDIVSFQLVASGIYGGQRTEVQVDSIAGYNTARYVDPELQAKHANLYRYFQDAVGNVDDATAYEYVILLNPITGTMEAIGIPWILVPSWTVVSTQNNLIQITNWQEKMRAPLTTFLNNLGATYVMNLQAKTQ